MTDQAKRMDFSRFPRKSIVKDDTLFFEEDESREIYVLLTGALGVFRDEVQIATIDEPLAIVGEVSALTSEPRNATVRALRASNVVVVEEPDRLFEEYPQLGAKLSRLLAKRLSAMNARFVEMKGLLVRGAMAPSTDGNSVTRSSPRLAIPSTTSAPSAVVAPGAIGGAERREYDDEILGALSDLLDWDPSADFGL